MSQIEADVLEHFRIQPISLLGGRVNQHWLVVSGREQLVLRRWSEPAESVDYEVRLLSRVAALGWPVAPVVAGPVEINGHHWTLFPFIAGDSPSEENPATEQRARGRLLAELHADLASLSDFGQRGKWRRCEAILSDPTQDQILTEHERQRPEDVRIVRWHLDRARERIAGLTLTDRPGTVVHGDFTAANLRFHDGKLSGILDFELSHWDHRIGEFPLAWRGKYDDVIFGYNEVSPLEPEEWALITPLWWALLIEWACQDMQNGRHGDDWTIKKLLERSPLMGPDSAEFR